MSTNLETKAFKNGKVIVKGEGIVVEIDFPRVNVADVSNRYYYFVFEGTKLQGATVERKIEIAVEEMEQYKKIRGTRTSWTLDDGWMRKWKAKQ